ncbi:UNVERIFIED_CONTAM: hypothetical protein Scaly_2878300 [Sesamum calycinum]|uniref:Reverse transcriptase/retrotransposon-derived protein RNase H-like domain-containing protein n=1 Tax=Sesamum calycinum TaxID=2727403 RepID=A0AAW2L7J9_9LAMI
MPAPSTEKKVRGGRLQYKSRFIAKLTSVCEPPLLRKDQPVVWNEQCQIAFDNMKEYLMNLPVLQQPRPGKPLIFYFAIEETSVGAMVPKKVVKGRAVAEFLAQQPIDDDQEWSLEFPDEHLRSITVQGWRMYFDGASNKAGAGIGVIIVTPVSDARGKSLRDSTLEEITKGTLSGSFYVKAIQYNKVKRSHSFLLSFVELALGFDSYTKFNPSDTSPPRMVPLPLPKESSL